MEDTKEMAGKDEHLKREGMPNRIHDDGNASQKSGTQLPDSCSRNYRRLAGRKEPEEDRGGTISRQQNE